MKEDKAKEMLDNILNSYEKTGYFTYQSFNDLLKELESDREVSQYDSPLSEMAYVRGLFLKRELESVK